MQVLRAAKKGRAVLGAQPNRSRAGPVLLHTLVTLHLEAAFGSGSEAACLSFVELAAPEPKVRAQWLCMAMWAGGASKCVQMRTLRSISHQPLTCKNSPCFSPHFAGPLGRHRARQSSRRRPPPGHCIHQPSARARRTWEGCAAGQAALASGGHRGRRQAAARSLAGQQPHALAAAAAAERSRHPRHCQRAGDPCGAQGTRARGCAESSWG